MKKKELQAQLETLGARLEAAEKKVELIGEDFVRPSIISSNVQAYSVNAPLYSFLREQPITAIKSFARTYKVIDDLGPAFVDSDHTGMISPDDIVAQNCSHTIDTNSCQREVIARRVATDAPLVDTDVEVPFVAGRDGIPSGQPRTMGEYRDMKLGEQQLQSKDIALNIALGSASDEMESVQTLINQNTTPNVHDNYGMGAFEIPLMGVLISIGVTTRADSYTVTDPALVLYTHPNIGQAMMTRSRLPGLEQFYTVDTNGNVRFMNIPVITDKNVYVDSDTMFTDIFVLRRGAIGLIEEYSVDREVMLTEENTGTCGDDTKRLYNYLTGVAMSPSTMGRLINVPLLMGNTIYSGLSNTLNNASAGAILS